ncbi:MAG: AI-2E family transporter, partial [Oscillospiraceae bacterium]|nr:AI-2E family transporter [Oscillospiraceae bacterium]
VGQSVGLPSAWVLAAIVTGGGLFGISGMLLGVPLAAVLCAVCFPEDSKENKPEMKES